MRLSYDGIEFQVLKVEAYSVTPIYDAMAGLDYLYDQVKLDVVCILNKDWTDRSAFPPPASLYQPTALVTEFTSGGNRPWNGLSVQGKFDQVSQPQFVGGLVGDGLTQGSTGPAATLVELFRRLRQPRRTLRLWMDSNPDPTATGDQAQETILLSPLPGAVVDCQGGPTCSFLQPLPIGSNASMALRLQFETHIPGCTDSSAPVLLSNRWSFTVSAENDYSIHIIEGEARFRMDLLHLNMMSADQFRNQFLHPIPVGFRREKPTVTLLPSGDGVRYQLLDREMPLNFPGGIYYGLNRVEIDEVRAYKAPIGIISGAIG